MNTMNGNKVYTSNEVAKITGRSDWTVRYWIKTGKLAATQTKGGSRTGLIWQIKKADLDKFLSDRHIQESFVQNEAGVKTIPSTLIYRDKIRAMIEDAIRAEIQRAVKEAVSSVMNDIIAA